MPVDVLGIDHVYVTVRDLAAAEAFYDRVMTGVLGYRKASAPIGGEPHRHYFNRHFGFSIRPARAGTADHDPYAPGLHHFCFRARSREDVDAVHRFLVDELAARSRGKPPARVRVAASVGLRRAAHASRHRRHPGAHARPVAEAGASLRAPRGQG